MIVYVLFVHKQSVSNRKVCIIIIKNKKLKTQKKTFCGLFEVVFFWFFREGFLGGFFIANPDSRPGPSYASPQWTRPAAPRGTQATVPRQIQSEHKRLSAVSV
jgi:hypothetical protein